MDSENAWPLLFPQRGILMAMPVTCVSCSQMFNGETGATCPFCGFDGGSGEQKTRCLTCKEVYSRTPSNACPACRTVNEFGSGWGVKSVALEFAVPLSTTQSLPGSTIVRVVGPVTAMSGFRSEGITPVSNRKMNEGAYRQDLINDALKDLADAAVILGANAVVGIQMQAIAGNIGGATIGTAAGRGDEISMHLLGTAVVTEPILDSANAQSISE